MSWRGKTLKKRYRLDDRIAVGRTVEVFRGYDLIEERDVAIKQPLPHLLSDRDFCDSFRAASVRAVRLRNPGLVEVLDYGLEEERPFVVMDLVMEKSLNEILTNGRKMKSLGGMYFAVNVGRTLAYLHEQGVTHGSLDERHIFILPGRAAKLSDPGFPTVLGGASTPYPFSQDPRRDIQDFGYLLYRSLTGKDKDEAAEDVKKGRLQLDPEIPERERRFVQLCLESSGSGGFASAEQMVWEAVTILREEQPMVDVSAAASAEEVVEGAEAPHPFTLPQLKRWQILTGTTVMVVAAVFFLVWILSTIIAPSKVQVPNFVNMSVEEARKVADANDLGLLVVDKTYDANVKTNYIISQSPQGGEMVKEKTLVQVLESLGPLTVPNLVGLSLEDARTVLDSRGFKVGEISYREVADFTPNHVLETDPPYGAKLSSGAAVNLVVSKSP